ncbi:MAG: V-type ATP synthase subunit E family protein [Candidatus Methanoglobus sp.]
MPLDAFLEEIRRKGEEEIKKIEIETKKEVEKIISDARAEAELILKKAREEAEKEGEALRRQEISSLNLELKRIILSKQKEITDEVFKKLRQKIAEMDEKTREKILESLIKRNAKDGMLIYVRKEDEAIVKNIIKKAGINLKIAGNISALGGILLEEQNGEVRINLTFDEMLLQLYEKKLSEVSKVLFG